jgi:hypothetical protein
VRSRRERLLSEHGNDSFQITIHCSTYIINVHTISWIYFTTFQYVDYLKKIIIRIFGVLTPFVQYILQTQVQDMAGPGWLNELGSWIT